MIGVESEPHLERAGRHAELGLPVPAGAKHVFLKRLVLKLTWFTTRHQMEHNLAMVAAVADLEARVAALADLENRLVVYRHHVAQILAGIEASLRAEILGSDRRGDRLETDLVRLSATVAALQAQLDSLDTAIGTGSPDAADRELTHTESAAVRSLPGQIQR
jgi:hypothetical protein